MLLLRSATPDLRPGFPPVTPESVAVPAKAVPAGLVVGRGVLRRKSGFRKAPLLVSLGIHGAVAVAWVYLVLPVQDVPDRLLVLEFPPEVTVEEAVEAPPPPPPAVEEPLPDPEPPEELPPEDVSPPVDLPAGAFVDDDGLRDAFATGLGGGKRRRRTGPGPGTTDSPGVSPAPMAPAPIYIAPRTTGPSRRASILLDDCEEPDYPALARSRGWEGRVVITVEVSAEGTVTSAEVIESSGHALLDEAALEAVHDWRFQPALRDGEAVPDRLRLPIRFQIRQSQ